MKLRRLNRKGTMIVLSVGMMVVVGFMAQSQLTTLRLNMDIRKNYDYQQMADQAGRSGIDYGYTMIKNVMEAMSLVGLRFATHYYDADTITTSVGRVADVPPYWQEVINFYFDRRAYASQGVKDSSGNQSGEARFVGTDAYTGYQNPAPFDENPNFNAAQARANLLLEPSLPMDWKYAESGYGSGFVKTQSLSHRVTPELVPSAGFVARTTYAYLSDGDTKEMDYRSRMRDCSREKVDGTTYVFYPAQSQYAPGSLAQYMVSECAHIAWTAAGKPTPPVTSGDPADDGWYVTPHPASTSGIGYEDITDGHFGTKRWHYYDSWNFSPPPADFTEAVPLDVNATRGTGGMIVRGHTGATLNLFRRDAADTGISAKWDDYKDILFERLFNYKRNNALAKYPFEPGDYSLSGAADTPHARDASTDAYHVQMFTGLDLDIPASGATIYQDMRDHTNYANVQYKIFFKIWVTRDESRNGYGGAITNPGLITKELWNSSLSIFDWKGSAIPGTASDLHPLWVIPRIDAGRNIAAANTIVPAGIDLRYTSYWRPDYLSDYLNSDGETTNTNKLGVLQFPVPYLAYQRADYDQWTASVRSTAATTQTSSHKDFTKFILWSLGTVREIDQAPANIAILEANHKITDFKIVAKALYKMEFYMDTRAVDISDDPDYPLYLDHVGATVDNPAGGDISKPTITQTAAAFACSASPPGNQSNYAFYNSRFISACDLPSGTKKLFEPVGIYTKSIEKVNYNDSKL